MFVLGISAFYHDSAACIIKDGIIMDSTTLFPGLPVYPSTSTHLGEGSSLNSLGELGSSQPSERGLPPSQLSRPTPSRHHIHMAHRLWGNGLCVRLSLQRRTRERQEQNAGRLHRALGERTTNSSVAPKCSKRSHTERNRAH